MAFPIDLPRMGRVKTDAFTKNDLLERLHTVLNESFPGMKVSKNDTWKIFKLVFHTSFELASQKKEPDIEGKNKYKGLTLSGIGKFFVITTKREGKEKKRLRFKPSTRIDRILQEGLSFLQTLEKVVKERKPRMKKTSKTVVEVETSVKKSLTNKDYDPDF